MLEQELQKEIIKYLTLNGWMVWKNKNINRTTGKYITGQQRGVPDLTALKYGIVWFLEIKTEKGRLSEDQKEFGRKIIGNLGNFAVLRSLEDAKKLSELRMKREYNDEGIKL